MISTNLPVGQAATQVDSSRYKVISLHAVQSSVVGPVQLAQGSAQAYNGNELFIKKRILLR